MTSDNASPNLSAQLAPFTRFGAVADDLQALSAQNGLVLSEATFQPVSTMVNTDIGRMEIVGRLKGGYPAFKKTVAALLATHDGLALESLSILRGRSTDTVMDIDVRFSYFYRKH